MSFNVKQLGKNPKPEKLKNIVSVFKKHKPDIIGLQEVFDKGIIAKITVSLNEEKDFTWKSQVSDNLGKNGEKSAFIYKEGTNGLEGKKFEKIPINDNFPLKRAIFSGSFEWDKKSFKVWNIHLSQIRPKEEIQRIGKHYLKNGAEVVLGDFNARCDITEFDQWKEKYLEASLGYDVPTNLRKTEQYDNVWFDIRKFKLKEAQVVKSPIGDEETNFRVQASLFSDHLPILCKLVTVN